MELRTITDKNGRLCFSGRELFKAFGLHGDYNAWFKGLKEFGFTEGQHYTTVFRSSKHHGKDARKWRDHLITGIMADELCLLLPTDDAHRSREELLLLWYRWQFEPMSLYKRLLEISSECENFDNLQKDIPIRRRYGTQPSKEINSYADLVRAQKEALTITKIADDYGISGLKLNRILEDAGIQYRVYGTWRLHPDFADQDYVVKESHGYNDHEGAHQEGYRLKWTPKGRMLIYQIMKASGISPIMEEIHHE